MLYYIGSNPAYSVQRNEVLKDAKEVLESFSAIEYSEAAHLLLDLISCPYLTTIEKKDLAILSIKTSHGFTGVSDQLINELINYAKDKSWFSNWNSSDTLKNLLKKKEFMLSY
jgi:hypothetical protein